MRCVSVCVSRVKAEKWGQWGRGCVHDGAVMQSSAKGQLGVKSWLPLFEDDEGSFSPVSFQGIRATCYA